MQKADTTCSQDRTPYGALGGAGHDQVRHIRRQDRRRPSSKVPNPTASASALRPRDPRPRPARSASAMMIGINSAMRPMLEEHHEGQRMESAQDDAGHHPQPGAGEDGRHSALGDPVGEADLAAIAVPITKPPSTSQKASELEAGEQHVRRRRAEHRDGGEEQQRGENSGSGLVAQSRIAIAANQPGWISFF